MVMKLILPTLTLYFFIFTKGICQTDVVFSGRLVRGKENCIELIYVTSPKENPYYHQYILPTQVPDDIKYWFQFQFKFTPLRQPVPDECRAKVVAMIEVI